MNSRYIINKSDQVLQHLVETFTCFKVNNFQITPKYTNKIKQKKNIN